MGQVQHPGGKLAYLAASQGLTLREFMLKNLNKHKSMTAMAKAMDVTPARIRIDMARAGVVEVRKYGVANKGRAAPLTVSYVTEEKMLT